MRLASFSRGGVRSCLGLAFMAASAIVLLLLGLTTFRFLLAGLVAACLVMAAALWWIHGRAEKMQTELVQDLLNQRRLHGR